MQSVTSVYNFESFVQVVPVCPLENIKNM